MKELQRMDTFLWRVYSEYKILESNKGPIIVPDRDRDIIKTYNPLDEYSLPFKKRSKVFVAFANVEQNQSSIIEIFKEYGPLWLNNNLLSDINEEIRALKNAWEIYQAISEREIGKLKNIIKMINAYDRGVPEKLLPYNDAVNKTIDLIEFNTGLKKEPPIQLKLEKPYNINNEFYLNYSLFYLIELIIFRIKLNGGALPSYNKIVEDEKNPLGYSTIPSFDCKNLAAALWIQFYNLVTSYQKLIKCKNKYCKMYFEKDGKREYCSPSCKKAQNMRDWRASKKLKS